MDDQILSAAAGLLAAVDQQLAVLDAQIAVRQKRAAELEAIISAPPPLGDAELFFAKAMIDPALREAEARAAELPESVTELEEANGVEPIALMEVEPVASTPTLDQWMQREIPIEKKTKPLAASQVLDTSEFERKLLVAYG